MSLTSDGQVLLKHVRRILANLTDAGRELSELQGLEKGEIRIGASAMLSTYFLPTFLFGFKKQYPGMQIRLVEAGTHTLEKMIIAGELDLAMLQASSENDDIRYSAHLNEEVVACLPIHHHLTEKSSLTIEEFCQQPSVMFRKGYYLRDSVDARALNANLALDIQLETNLVDLLKQFVKNGIGIGTCLPMIVENEPLLCVRPFDPPIHLDLAWAWKKNHYLSKATQAFLAFYEKNTASD